MAGGWAKDGAVQEQIDASVADAVSHARNQLNCGESLTFCEECDEKIPLARRKALQGIRFCISCQEKHDNTQKQQQGFNRAGSKDSQLR